MPVRSDGVNAPHLPAGLRLDASWPAQGCLIGLAGGSAPARIRRQGKRIACSFCGTALPPCRLISFV